MLATILQMLAPGVEMVFDVLVKWRMAKAENKEKFLSMLKNYNESGTPAETQNAYSDILKEIKNDQKSKGG